MKSALSHIEDVFAYDAEFDKARIEANLELLNFLGDYIMNHPTERFGQVLRNLGIVVESNLQEGGHIWLNGFNEEPQDTLTRVKKSIADADNAEKNGG